MVNTITDFMKETEEIFDSVATFIYLSAGVKSKTSYWEHYENVYLDLIMENKYKQDDSIVTNRFTKSGIISVIFNNKVYESIMSDKRLSQFELVHTFDRKGIKVEGIDGLKTYITILFDHLNAVKW